MCRRLLFGFVSLALIAVRATPDEGVVVVETAHYRLMAETTPAQAKEYAAVLEAAWPEYEKFFSAAPDLGAGEKLVVHFAATREGFVSALTADRQPVPRSGGYYSPGTRAAYLWRQPTIYYTRCLLLHEAAHQFHFLSRTGNRPIPVEWYVEGIAEYLCRHRWDGARLELGVLPFVSLKDYAAAALSELDGGADLAPAADTGVLSRPLSWALVRFLLTGKREKRFRDLMDRYDRHAGGPELLRKLFGPPAKLTAALETWLRGEQEPWSQVFNQWEEIAPGRVRGTAGPAIASFCRKKGEARRIRAELEIPETAEWTGGLLLAFAGRDDYTIGFVTSRRTVYVNRRKDGKWTTLARGICPDPAPDHRLRLEAERDGARVRFTVGDTGIGTFELAGPVFGLCLQGGTATFSGVHAE